MREECRDKSGSMITVWVLAMLLIPAIFMFLPKSMDLPLDGVVSYTKPTYSIKAMWEGTFQSEVENYLSGNLGLRGTIIRAGNQLRYSLFRTCTHDTQCLGKNGQIYELEYVYKKTQLYAPVSQEYVDEIVTKLEAIQKTFNERGTQLFVFITPSKAEIYPEDIPDVYVKCSPQQQTSSYELLLKGLESSSVPYFDSIPYVNNEKAQGAKIFALTGTHWTQSTGAKVSSQLIKELENAFGYDMTEYTVQENATDQPLAPDADIFNLLNVLQEPYDSYTAPQINVVKTGTESPSLICRGGSFMGQTMTYLVFNDVVSDAIHIENTNIFSEKYSQIESFSSYDEVDVDAMLKDKQILLLEVNQGAIDKMSFGFIDYLYENYVEEK